MDRPERRNELESTLLWITTGYRVFAAIWLSILALVVVSSDTTDVANTAVVAGTTIGVVSWASLATVVAILRPHLLRTWWFVAMDLALSSWTVIAGSVAGTIQFAGGYPLVGAFTAIYAFGLMGGVIGAATLTAFGLVTVLGESERSQQAANAVAYIFSVGAATGVAAALRSSDRRRAAAEAALAHERSERVRAEEHAEVAAHLHDSVLQTLALIQRDPTATPDIRGLARHQERELRDWLFPQPGGADPTNGGFREALVAVCSEVEDLGGVRIELVVVGNTAAPVDAIVRAGREAMLNARAHAGVELVSVYGEVTDHEVSVFVKDRGAGFDPDLVTGSRLGISESIVGRMKRNGGSAEVISAPGSGTEVRLHLPLDLEQQ